MEFNFNEIDAKWQLYWAQNHTYKTDNDSNLPKYYILDMFPYPSGSGLHVGHPLGYVASDIYARYKRLKGFNVLHPMGFDAFGLPAEQYAIETGKHPEETTLLNIQKYRSQLDKIGFSFDWSRQVITADPSYYKHTQWMFLQFFNAWYNPISNKAEPIESLLKYFETHGNSGLQTHHNTYAKYFTASEWLGKTNAEQQEISMHYRLFFLGDAYVWFCPALGCVLANDEVKEGLSERGGHPVEKRKMRQWFQRITAYCDRLLDDIVTLQWSESIKEIQRNWIGKSIGAIVDFKLENSETTISVFTTRPDTIFGVSFIVIAPEHELIGSLVDSTHKIEVENYIKYTKSRSERERMSEVKKITGCFTGAYAMHPLTQVKLPIWTSEYVIATYGTGAIMAVPAGDERDHAFASFFKLEMPAIFEAIDTQHEASTNKDSLLKNSDFLNGLSSNEATQKVIEKLVQLGAGIAKTNYKIRDAGFARQRYWGEPFPIVYKDGIATALPLNELPVLLPKMDNFAPSALGAAPLSANTKWVDVAESCKREVDTMPGNAGSSWYYFRYMDPNNIEAFASKKAMDYWGQVDIYLGGTEHATGHLLYARLWTKILFDLGYVSIEEPFKKLINQGMILGENNEKMSKSKGNTVNPDDIVLQYGADCFRMYEMFLGPIEDSKPWNTKGITGVSKFLSKFWNLYIKAEGNNLSLDKANENELKLLHRFIKKTEEEIHRFSFNTCVSGFMIITNELQTIKCNKREILEPLLILLSPFAPHICEELWRFLGYTSSITKAKWPLCNELFLVDSIFNYPIAVNGKTKANRMLSLELGQVEVENIINDDMDIVSFTGGNHKKIIFVKGKMINIVV